jgi:ferredoxin-thioredoxin reductase catalytic subunit
MYIGEVDTTNNKWKNVNSYNGSRNTSKFNTNLETYIIIIARKISNKREFLIENCPNQYSYEQQDWK